MIIVYINDDPRLTMTYLTASHIPFYTEKTVRQSLNEPRYE